MSKCFSWGQTTPGDPRLPTFFCHPLKKSLKSRDFELEWWYLHVNRSFFQQKLNRKGPMPMVPANHYLQKKAAIIQPGFSTLKNFKKRIWSKENKGKEKTFFQMGLETFFQIFQTKICLHSHTEVRQTFNYVKHVIITEKLIFLQ